MTRKEFDLSRMASVSNVMDDLRQRLEDALNFAADAKDKFEHQTQQLADNESEINLLKQRLTSVESERESDKNLIETLQRTINLNRSEFNDEKRLLVDAELKRESMWEELKWTKNSHEKELLELKNFSCTDSNDDYFATEMSRALRDMQDVYDKRLDAQRAELEKTASGNGSSTIKALYEAELEETRRQLEESVNEKRQLETKLALNECTMDEMRHRLNIAYNDAADAKEKLESQKQEVSDLETEVDILKRRLDKQKAQNNKRQD